MPVFCTCKTCQNEQRSPIQVPRALVSAIDDNRLRCSQCLQTNNYGKGDYFWRDVEPPN